MEIQACQVPQGYRAVPGRLAAKEDRGPWVHTVRGTNVLMFLQQSDVPFAQSSTWMLSYVSPGVPGVKGEKGDKGVGEMGDSGPPGAPGLTPSFQTQF